MLNLAKKTNLRVRYQKECSTNNSVIHFLGYVLPFIVIEGYKILPCHKSAPLTVFTLNLKWKIYLIGWVVRYMLKLNWCASGVANHNLNVDKIQDGLLRDPRLRGYSFPNRSIVVTSLNKRQCWNTIVRLYSVAAAPSVLVKMMRVSELTCNDVSNFISQVFEVYVAVNWFKTKKKSLHTYN